jgi:starch synthase
LAKVGGLADFAAALTRQLSRRGHDVRLFVPAYGSIEWGDHEVGAVDELRQVPVSMGGRTLHFDGLAAQPSGFPAPVYFIDCPQLYGRPEIYSARPEESVRFAFLTRATIECCQRMRWAPHVFHCNDWHTAILPLYLQSTYAWDQMFAGSGTLLTIHNIGYQGICGVSALAEIGLPEWAARVDSEDLGAGRFNFLKAGIASSDLISTVSPTHAREIQTAVYGMGLQHLLRERRDRLTGILNGVDCDEWSPATDELIPHPFALHDLRGKARNKRALFKEVGLSFAAGAPLLGLVSRLVEQKGIDLMAAVLPELLERRPLRLIALGAGEERYESLFGSLHERFPDRVHFRRGYDNRLAHRIEAASDVFLMPSRYEPCGLNQMYSLCYGAVPVVRRTGGLADSVEPFDPVRRTGTGFLFEDYRAESFRQALEAALDIYPQRSLWRRLVRNGMQKDFCWERQVVHYEEVYRRLATL